MFNAVCEFLLVVVMLCARHVPLYPGLLGPVHGGDFINKCGSSGRQPATRTETPRNFNYITWTEERGGEELRTRSEAWGRVVSCQEKVGQAGISVWRGTRIYAHFNYVLSSYHPTIYVTRTFTDK